MTDYSEKIKALEDSIEPVTKTTVAGPRWFTNGNQWCAVWYPDGDVRAFLTVGGKYPSIEEVEEKKSAGIPCHPFTKETMQSMIMMESMTGYYATGESPTQVIFECGVPYSEAMTTEVFDVHLVIEDGTPVSIGIKPRSERMEDVWNKKENGTE